MSTPDFAKGASGPSDPYTSLGQNLAYLGGAHASASATAGSGTTGTSFPTSPSDAQLYTYVADGTNGVLWTFRYYTTGAYWAFVGGPPLYSAVATNESRASVNYGALATAGPSIVLPFAADYDIETGAAMYNGSAGGSAFMSYDIGATGAVDADAVAFTADSGGTGNNNYNSMSRRQRKTGLTAVTLTAKYHSGGADSANFVFRYMAVWPVKK